MKAFFAGLRGLLYGTGFVLVWAWVALEVRRYDRYVPAIFPSWSAIAGIVFMCCGGFIALSCVSLFASAGKGTPAPFDPPREFVAAGPYRYVRNPMYIGGWLVMAGFGLTERSAAILILTMILALCSHLFVVFYEEPSLERRFGESYRQYKSTVNRWLPAVISASINRKGLP